MRKKSKIIELAERYEEIPKKELPRIWYDLIIKDKWAEELGDAPDGLGTSSCWEVEYICEKIQDECGSKSFFRYMYVNEGEFTDQMFDDLWESKRHGQRTAKAFYEEAWEKRLETKQYVALGISIFSLIVAIVVLVFS